MPNYLFSVTTDLRFVGSYADGRSVHIMPFSEMEQWAKDLTHKVHTLCGYEFRPSFCSTMTLDSDSVCPTCLTLSPTPPTPLSLDINEMLGKNARNSC